MHETRDGNSETSACALFSALLVVAEAGCVTLLVLPVQLITRVLYLHILTYSMNLNELLLSIYYNGCNMYDIELLYVLYCNI